MNKLNDWPDTVRVYIAAIAIAALVSCVLDPNTSTFVLWAFIGIASGAIAFYQSRIGWWLMSLFGVTAMIIALFTVSKHGVAAQLDWQSWLSILVEGIAVAALISPPMFRWVRPLGAKRSPE